MYCTWESIVTDDWVWTMDNRQRTTDDRQGMTDDGQRTTDDGQWTTDYGWHTLNLSYYMIAHSSSKRAWPVAGFTRYAVKARENFPLHLPFLILIPGNVAPFGPPSSKWGAIEFVSETCKMCKPPHKYFSVNSAVPTLKIQEYLGASRYNAWQIILMWPHKNSFRHASWFFTANSVFANPINSSKVVFLLGSFSQLVITCSRVNMSEGWSKQIIRQLLR